VADLDEKFNRIVQASDNALFEFLD